MDVDILLDKASVVKAIVEFALGVRESARVGMALLGLEVVVDLGVVVLLLRVDGDKEVGRFGNESVCCDVARF